MRYTYVVVDGENIDATLGMSVLGHRPDSSERPRWDRVYDFASTLWNIQQDSSTELECKQPTKGLFFLNVSSGLMPMAFVQALVNIHWQPIPLASTNENDKVVDLGIQRTLDAIVSQPEGDVILVSHDVDFINQMTDLLAANRRVAVFCFREFLSTQLAEIEEKGLEIYDLEHDVDAFQVPLPRVKIIDINDFDPHIYL